MCIHADYAGNRALIDIRTAAVIRGALPNRQLKLVLAWREIHRDELMANWHLAERNEPLRRITPLT